MATVFLPEDVAVVASHVRHAKIASFEAEDVELWRAWTRATLFWDVTRWVVVSLGMGARWEPTIEAANMGIRVRRLHCVSSYPATIESLQLSGLWASWDTDGDRVDPLDGFSDHSDPALTWTGALATAAGASILEAHLRLDDTDPVNPDYSHAMTPRQFAEYVRNIRFCEVALGDGDKRIQPCEKQMAQYRVLKRE